MERYQKGKIYKIVCKDSDKVYIGATCEQYLSDRLKGHRNAYKTYLNNKRNYVSSFDIIKNNNYYIELIELYPCQCIEELNARERHYINSMDCVNKNCIELTEEEKKDIRKEQNKKYYEKVKNDKILKKITCGSCNKEICANSYKNHLKSAKCQLSKYKKQEINEDDKLEQE
jgi:hypothetical protein